MQLENAKLKEKVKHIEAVQLENTKLKNPESQDDPGAPATQGVAYSHVSSTNVALGRPTTQSLTDHGKHSPLAVDGNTDPLWNGDSVTATTAQDDPWWRVDLQTQRSVAVVRVTNAQAPNGGKRLDLFTIKVGNKVCRADLVVPPSETGDFLCKGGPLVGSTVTIELPGVNRILVVRHA